MLPARYSHGEARTGTWRRREAMKRIAVTAGTAVILLGISGMAMVPHSHAKLGEQETQQVLEDPREIVTGEQDHPDRERASDAPADDLANFHFLVGTWRGELGGGLVEEIWSQPQGNAMMGMFRWLNADGGTRLYELLTISREAEATYLRLRHFTSEMIAWEEKDAPVVLKLTESSTGRAVFVNESPEERLERIVFHQKEPGRLAIDVVFREGSQSGPLNFRFTAAE